jgi:[acyl-carrier-protein] S-malonyltransferase
MMKAYIFPGQGSQFPGMGKDLYNQFPEVRTLFHQADECLGFSLSEIMFSGSAEDLKQTNVTQPAVFLHSIAAFQALPNPDPAMVAGHSLGEITALVACGCLSFPDALKLVSVRANAMHKACVDTPSTMAAVLRYPADEWVEALCKEISGEIVVPANYNCPGQIVISGSLAGIELAIEKIKSSGLAKAMKLPVGGAFHSPLMEPARAELAEVISRTSFSVPRCPVYQNIHARAEKDPANIKQALIAQLTGSVRWTQTILQMIADGADEFVEVGPGKVLTGLVDKIRSAQ